MRKFEKNENNAVKNDRRIGDNQYIINSYNDEIQSEDVGHIRQRIRNYHNDLIQLADDEYIRQRIRDLKINYPHRKWIHWINDNLDKMKK